MMDDTTTSCHVYVCMYVQTVSCNAVTDCAWEVGSGKWEAIRRLGVAEAEG